MNVLIFGNDPQPIRPFLITSGCNIIETDAQINVDYLRDFSIEFAISYRYRHIVRKPVIDFLKGQIINLHISLLPWNRGADPNLWSFLENTPKGVTIHYIDEGLDTGDIIAQKETFFDIESETLATTYRKLNKEMITLFEQQWPLIMQGNASRKKQLPAGTYHRISDKEKYAYLFAEKGWDTPVKQLIGKGSS